MVTRIVAVCNCPAGVAHTYMSAESLIQAAKKRSDVTMRVEIQGQLGFEDKLKPVEIAEADVVILTNAAKIREQERFAGKSILYKEPNWLIRHGNEAIDEALALVAQRKEVDIGD
jgi:PTS system fructose-specific IIC component